MARIITSSDQQGGANLFIPAIAASPAPAEELHQPGDRRRYELVIFTYIDLTGLLAEVAHSPSVMPALRHRGDQRRCIPGEDPIPDKNHDENASQAVNAHAGDLPSVRHPGIDQKPGQAWSHGGSKDNESDNNGADAAEMFQTIHLWPQRSEKRR